MAAKAHISVTTLSTLLYDSMLTDGLSEGLLYGHIEDRKILSDDTDNATERHFHVLTWLRTGDRPYSFYDTAFETISPPPNPSGKGEGVCDPICGDLLGWFSYRRNSSAAPNTLTARERAVMQSNWPFGQPPLFFLMTQNNNSPHPGTSDITYTAFVGSLISVSSVALLIDNMRSTSAAEYQLGRMIAATKMPHGLQEGAQGISKALHEGVEATTLELRDLCAVADDAARHCEGRAKEYSAAASEVNVLRQKLAELRATKS